MLKRNFVGDRIEGEKMVLLYQIESFYVEVYYHPMSNEVMKHRSFSSTNQLDSYLKEINIEGITLILYVLCL